MTVQFVDANCAEFGVEPVCAALQVAPSTYWTSKRWPLSARALRDARMMPVLLALWQANYSVYGARKLWIAARRAGCDIGRDQVARLMGQLGIRGVKRAKKVRTTRADPKAGRPADLVERDFTAKRPNQLWGAEGSSGWCLTLAYDWPVCLCVDLSALVGRRSTQLRLAGRAVRGATAPSPSSSKAAPRWPRPTTFPAKLTSTPEPSPSPSPTTTERVLWTPPGGRSPCQTKTVTARCKEIPGHRCCGWGSASAAVSLLDLRGCRFVASDLADMLLSVELTTMIETRAGVRSGKPCFIGTRIAVYDVLDYLAAGMTPSEIADDFPELSEQHVLAAVEFAALRERRLATPA